MLYLPHEEAKSIGRACRTLLIWLAIVLFAPIASQAQVSFQIAIDLALQKSPQVKMAEDDVKKAKAVLSETKDVYIPVVVGSSGLGASSGITLTIPTIFTITAQSTVISRSQPDYIRAARSSIQASELALADVREQVVEDTAITYGSLDNALAQQAAALEETADATKLLSIMGTRSDAGLEAEIDVKRARLTVVRLQFSELQIEDQVASLRSHLGELLGIGAEQFVTVPASVPGCNPHSPSADTARLPLRESSEILSAAAHARAKAYQAFGDSRGTWIPQVTFDAQYGRISPFNNTSSYYNLQGDYNTLSVGVQLQLSFLDRGHSARARESAADALHAAHELAYTESKRNEDLLKLQRSLTEAAKRKEVAELEQGIAEDRLAAILVEENSGGNSTVVPVTPKDEQNARIDERQKKLDLLDADLQLQKAGFSLLRQTGGLEGWMRTCQASAR